MRIALFLILLASLFSCDDGVYTFLNRTTDLPVDEAPVVASFSASQTLEISWNTDPGSDVYILKKDTDPLGAFSQTVYEGTGTSYTDTSILDQSWYYYKLVKQRGKEYFTPEVYSYGIGSISVSDDNEPNNTKANATIVGNAVVSNIFYYRDSEGNTVVDTDWYKVDVWGGKALTLQFDNFSNIASQGISFTLDTGLPEPLNDGDTKSIANYDTDTKTFYFKITPDSSSFYDALAGGGSVGSYRVKFILIQDAP